LNCWGNAGEQPQQTMQGESNNCSLFFFEFSKTMQG